jgi:hypothetical protein
MARRIRLPRLSDPHLQRGRVGPARPAHREQRDGAEAIVTGRRRGSILDGAAPKRGGAAQGGGRQKLFKLCGGFRWRARQDETGHSYVIVIAYGR